MDKRFRVRAVMTTSIRFRFYFVARFNATMRLYHKYFIFQELFENLMIL